MGDCTLERPKTIGKEKGCNTVIVDKLDLLSTCIRFQLFKSIIVRDYHFISLPLQKGEQSKFMDILIYQAMGNGQIPKHMFLKLLKVLKRSYRQGYISLKNICSLVLKINDYTEMLQIRTLLMNESILYFMQIHEKKLLIRNYIKEGFYFEAGILINTLKLHSLIQKDVSKNIKSFLSSLLSDESDSSPNIVLQLSNIMHAMGYRHLHYEWLEDTSSTIMELIQHVHKGKTTHICNETCINGEYNSELLSIHSKSDLLSFVEHERNVIPNILIQRYINLVGKEIWPLLPCLQIDDTVLSLLMDLKLRDIVYDTYYNRIHYHGIEYINSILLKCIGHEQNGQTSQVSSTTLISGELLIEELLMLFYITRGVKYERQERPCSSQVIQVLLEEFFESDSPDVINLCGCIEKLGCIEKCLSTHTTKQSLQERMQLSKGMPFYNEPKAKLGYITKGEVALCHREHVCEFQRLLMKMDLLYSITCSHERNTKVKSILECVLNAYDNYTIELNKLLWLTAYGKCRISSSICFTNKLHLKFVNVNFLDFLLTTKISTDHCYLNRKKALFMKDSFAIKDVICEYTKSPEPSCTQLQEATSEIKSVSVCISKPKVEEYVRDFFCEKYLEFSGKMIQSYSDNEAVKYIYNMNDCKKDNIYQNLFDIERNTVVFPVFRHSLEESFKSLLNGCNPKAKYIMKYEMHRLNSFLEFSSDNAPSRIRLASNGWFSTGNGMETKCFSCGVAYANWKMDSDPVQIHESLSPQCSMVTGRDSENVAVAMQKTTCEETQDRNSSASDENSGAIHCATKERFPTGNVNSPTCEQVNITNHRTTVSTQNSILCNRNIESEKRNSSATKTEDMKLTVNNYIPSTVGQGYTIVNGNIADSRKPESIIQSQNNPGSEDLSRVSEDQLSISNPFNLEMSSSDAERCQDFHRNSLGPPQPLSRNRLTPNSNHTRQQNQNILSSVSKEKCPANVNKKSQEISVYQNRSFQTTTFNQTKYEGSNMLKGESASGQNGDKRQTQLHPKFSNRNQHLCGNLNVENGPQNTVKRPVNPSTPNEVLLYTLPPVKREAPRYPQYAVMTVRISSYKGWPSYLKQSERDLAMAGFYYRGYSDEVTCYQCGVTLANWQEDDDGCVEHARWRPECYYIRTYKGDEFVKLIQAALKQLQQTRNVESQQLCEQQPIQANRDITVDYMLEMLLGNQSSSSERLTDVPATATITRTFSSSSSSSSSSSLTNQTSSSVSSLSRDGPFSSVGSTQNRIAEVNVGPPITKSKGTHDKHDNKDLEQPPDNEASNEESKKKVECKICLDKEVGMIFMPCGHICACVTCSAKLQRCPVCRTYIKKKIRGYLS